MAFTRKMVRRRVLPAVFTGSFLCLANYAMDFLLTWFGTTAPKTVLNDVAIGILGGSSVFFYLSASQERHNFESAKERIGLIRELNLHIRNALLEAMSSAMSEDRSVWLQSIDKAVDRIDAILFDIQMGTTAGVSGPVKTSQIGSPRGF
jgi:hypothetical protein